MMQSMFLIGRNYAQRPKGQVSKSSALFYMFKNRQKHSETFVESFIRRQMERSVELIPSKVNSRPYSGGGRALRKIISQ